MLKKYYKKNGVEAGCDEAGRGCLAGPVFAAAVILPKNFHHPLLNDSKLITEDHRNELRAYIEEKAISYAVSAFSPQQIDEYNILWASIRCMHQCLDHLTHPIDRILVDGNKFLPYKDITYHTIVKGDGIYASIAAASVLAKTYRDEHMLKLHEKFPQYCWHTNKGYPTIEHRSAIIQHGPCEMHRQSFQLYPLPKQGSLFDEI